MRKHQKKRVDELLNLLGQAHEQIFKLLRNGNSTEVCEILGDCQKVAISIGTAIDEEEGEGSYTVKLLEEYCELVYQLNESIVQGNIISVNEVRVPLDKSLKNIKKAYNKDVHMQKEVVFMPYKAAMWDSLESVWEKYNNDPQWNAVVVPIPYFNKNPDGTLKEYHYEGEQFPEYVPIVSYSNYDLQGIHPDKIYIHNPYDECNFVTTVHPDYYSKKLKEQTDWLVYIPYFVLTERDPKNSDAVDSMAHFATVPGVVNADEVIVQSENMKKCYVEALVKIAGNDTRKIWEKKIKGTGSPKLQKAAEVKNQHYVYPEDWIKKTTNKEGKRKKVIFYNTSIQALLDNEGMIEKMRRVMEIFKNKSDEAVLLWRPHPLLEATVSAMRPDLWEKYSEVIKDFQSDDIGIYDDSADLYRAISIADAYYGDKSSVVHLFVTAGIPVMIQNADI